MNPPNKTPHTVHMNTPAANATSAWTGHVEHYENFPVASWLCPPKLRPPITAIYHFARTADDIADEGTATAAERITALASYRQALDAAMQGQVLDHSWPGVFGALAREVAAHDLPPAPLHDLLSAFEQDVVHTASQHRYADTAELLDYCSLSANPIGRLLLHLYGLGENSEALTQSDAICSALQLINFWQDISRDVPRARHYLPLDALTHVGLTHADVVAACEPSADPKHSAALSAVIHSQCDTAQRLLTQGAPLVRKLPGRLGWEMRLVIAGGQRILDKLQRQGHQSWRVRPALRWTDGPALLRLALRGPAG
jgi:squalene synthase HpnC